MNRILALTILSFAASFVGLEANENEIVSNERISEISQRLESYNTNSLIERRDFLISYQEADDQNDSNGVPAGSSSERAIEISIIDALLVALGVVILDDITEDSSTPPDTVFPVITILGDNPAIVELGSSYTDAGATSDGGETVTSSGTVDTNTVGTYTITYSATDSAGNTSIVTRTVNVVDTTAPVVTLSGASTVSVELGDDYAELGATATDASGTVSVVITGTVDTDTVGSYTVTYTSTDASGNEGTATRTVNVVDTLAPVITSSDTFTVDESLTETAIGTVTAYDNSTTGVTFAVSGTEIQITSGGVLSFVTAPEYEDSKSVYTATVTVTDASSNSSTQDITVNVNDKIAPVITSSDTFTVDESLTETAIGTVTAYDNSTTSLTFAVSGTEIQKKETKNKMSKISLKSRTESLLQKKELK
jgi:hypothetical protein